MWITGTVVIGFCYQGVVFVVDVGIVVVIISVVAVFIVVFFFCNVMNAFDDDVDDDGVVIGAAKSITVVVDDVEDYCGDILVVDVINTVIVFDYNAGDVIDDVEYVVSNGVIIRGLDSIDSSDAIVVNIGEDM